MTATTDISPRTGKPKRKYTKRVAPKTTAPSNTPEKPETPTPIDISGVVSNNLIPKLKETFTKRRAVLEGDIAKARIEIGSLQAQIAAAETELETVTNTLDALKDS